jgi:hypothetical protein
MRNVIYTAVMGRINDKIQIPTRSTKWDYVCFTDRKGWGGRGWDIRPPVWAHPTNQRRTARYHKTLSHQLFPDAEIVIWVDGCLTPSSGPEQLVRALKDNDLATFKHCERSCVYQELRACLRLKKDKPDLMRTQVERYRKEGYPPNNGLAETTCVVRRQTDQIKLLNEAWWAEITRGSQRDQLSLDYLCWKLGVQYSHLKGTRPKSPYFRWRPHR